MSEKGFTLLEVLVALSVIAIAMISVIRLQSQTIGMSEAVKFYSVAPFLAQAKITDALMDSQEYRGGASGGFGEDHPGFSWQVEINEKEPEPEDSPGLTLAEIRVRVSSGGSREMTYTVSRHQPAADRGLQD
ncbi:MAG: prepilin-type N-terminal cleavage/methylation domain-containing protein [Desulfobacterales bacterium]